MNLRDIFIFNGEDGTQTHNPRVANAMLYQLSYFPEKSSDRLRSGDLLITNQLLYQLSYTGVLIYNS
jgi:hypothetical protein